MTWSKYCAVQYNGLYQVSEYISFNPQETRPRPKDRKAGEIGEGIRKVLGSGVRSARTDEGTKADGISTTRLVGTVGFFPSERIP